MTMKTTTKLLSELIAHDPTLRGYTLEELPEAAKLRVANTMAELERHFHQEELLQLEEWYGGEAVWDTPVAVFDHPGSRHYVMPDGSSYWAASKKDRVIL